MRVLLPGVTPNHGSFAHINKERLDVESTRQLLEQGFEPATWPGHRGQVTTLGVASALSVICQPEALIANTVHEIKAALANVLDA